MYIYIYIYIYIYTYIYIYISDRISIYFFQEIFFIFLNSQMFHKIAAFKKFAIFTEKHLYRSF